MAAVGQIVKHGEFSIVKGQFMTPDLILAFYSCCPMDAGWEISESIQNADKLAGLQAGKLQ